MKLVAFTAALALLPSCTVIGLVSGAAMSPTHTEFVDTPNGPQAITTTDHSPVIILGLIGGAIDAIAIYSLSHMFDGALFGNCPCGDD
ncbi:MAG TPA: hypothetical protein VGM90_38475 [Kofleriaceae bacterium]|jgi:hypothetical protein